MKNKSRLKPLPSTPALVRRAAPGNLVRAAAVAAVATAIGCGGADKPPQAPPQIPADAQRTGLPPQPDPGPTDVPPQAPTPEPPQAPPEE